MELKRVRRNIVGVWSPTISGSGLAPLMTMITDMERVRLIDAFLDDVQKWYPDVLIGEYFAELRRRGYNYVLWVVTNPEDLRRRLREDGIWNDLSLYTISEGEVIFENESIGTIIAVQLADVQQSARVGYDDALRHLEKNVVYAPEQTHKSQMALRRRRSIVGMRDPRVVSMSVSPRESAFRYLDSAGMIDEIQEEFKEYYPNEWFSTYVASLERAGLTHIVWVKVSPEDIKFDNPQIHPDDLVEVFEIEDGEVLFHAFPEGIVAAVDPRRVTSRHIPFSEAARIMLRDEAATWDREPEDTPVETFGYLLKCGIGDQCDIIRGVAKNGEDDFGEGGFYDFGQIVEGTFIGDDRARLAIAERLRERVHQNVAVQLSGGLVSFDATGKIESVFSPTKELCERELERGGVRERGLFMKIPEGCVCVPPRLVKDFQDGGSYIDRAKKFQYVAWHPVATALIRSRYPLYEPTDIEFVGIASIQTRGIMVSRTLTPYINIIWLDAIGVLLATGMRTHDDVVPEIVHCIVHEMVHRAEAMSGVPYRGHWFGGGDLFGHELPVTPVGSELIAENIAFMAHEALRNYDGDLVTRRVAEGLDYFSDFAKESTDVLRLRDMMRDNPDIYFSGVVATNPEEGLVRIALVSDPDTSASVSVTAQKFGVKYIKTRMYEWVEIRMPSGFYHDLYDHAPMQDDFETWRHADF